MQLNHAGSDKSGLVISTQAPVAQFTVRLSSADDKLAVAICCRRRHRHCRHCLARGRSGYMNAGPGQPLVAEEQTNWRRRHKSQRRSWRTCNSDKLTMSVFKSSSLILKHCKDNAHKILYSYFLLIRIMLFCLISRLCLWDLNFSTYSENFSARYIFTKLLVLLHTTHYVWGYICYRVNPFVPLFEVIKLSHIPTRRQRMSFSQLWPLRVRTPNTSSSLSRVNRSRTESLRMFMTIRIHQTKEATVWMAARMWQQQQTSGKDCRRHHRHSKSHYGTSSLQGSILSMDWGGDSYSAFLYFAL